MHIKIKCSYYLPVDSMLRKRPSLSTPICNARKKRMLLNHPLRYDNSLVAVNRLGALSHRR